MVSCIVRGIIRNYKISAIHQPSSIGVKTTVRSARLAFSQGSHTGCEGRQVLYLRRTHTTHPKVSVVLRRLNLGGMVAPHRKQNEQGFLPARSIRPKKLRLDEAA